MKRSTTNVPSGIASWYELELSKSSKESTVAVTLVTDIMATRLPVNKVKRTRETRLHEASKHLLSPSFGRLSTPKNKNKIV